MRTELFDFDLPAELIAQHPVAPRDAARLLVVAARGLADRQVRDLPALLAPGDLLVLNDTRVIPARLLGRRGAATVEVTLHQPQPGGGARWLAFAKPARRLKPGDRLDFAPDLAAEVVARGEGGEVTLAFACSPPALLERLQSAGQMPLPPYIRRPKGGDPRDRDDYQTLFAKHPGAVAAPTAALHFTPALMQALAVRGIGHAFVTLHVGAGTFLPVKAGGYRRASHARRALRARRRCGRRDRADAGGGRPRGRGRHHGAAHARDGRGGRRHARARGRARPACSSRPATAFRVVDRLLTNFHLPRSTLFMLVAAFAGLARMQAAYAHAIAAALPLLLLRRCLPARARGRRRC